MPGARAATALTATQAEPTPTEHEEQDTRPKTQGGSFLSQTNCAALNRARTRPTMNDESRAARRHAQESGRGRAEREKSEEQGD